MEEKIDYKTQILSDKSVWDICDRANECPYVKDKETFLKYCLEDYENCPLYYSSLSAKKY